MRRGTGEPDPREPTDPLPPADDDAGSRSFADELIRWQRAAGRHDLPWQQTRDPYLIWVSEIMLQQTQVATVAGYYRRFVERFPTLRSLADAELDEVLRHWSGLGYYSRARNLHRCARLLVDGHGGSFPRDPAALATLPGIGRSTAAAIAAFAWGVPAPILDGNVKRVLCRVFGIDGFPGERAVEAALWQVAARELPGDSIEAYTQGLMDLGATVCTRARPRCGDCPMQRRCVAHRSGRVTELPAARPARVVPTRFAELVLVRYGAPGASGAAVLVERRPPVGIWGGLLSLPEFMPPRAEPWEPADRVAPQVAAWLRARHRLEIAQPLRHSEIRHAFTHFRLRARIWIADRIAADGPAAAASDVGAVPQWLPLDDVAQAALPRPIKSLLAASGRPQIT